MAENTFEDRLTRLEEQFQALQALTLRLAAWETGGTGTVERDATAPGRAAARKPALAGDQSGRDRDGGLREEPAEGSQGSDR